MRNLLDAVAKHHKEMVAATVRTIFAQPDEASTRNQLRVVADMLREGFPAAADLLDDAKPTSAPTPPSPEPTGPSSGPPTRSNGSTARSNDAATSLASSPTTTR